MSNLLAKGRAMLVRRLQQAAAPADTDGLFPLYYQPLAGGDLIVLTGRAWVGRTVFVRRDPTQRGPAVEFGDRDYLIPAAELAAEPVRGDRIIEQVGNELITFEIITPAGEPAWRWSDPARAVYRVHTKEVSRSTGDLTGTGGTE